MMDGSLNGGTKTFKIESILAVQLSKAMRTAPIYSTKINH